MLKYWRNLIDRPNLEGVGKLRLEVIYRILCLGIPAETACVPAVHRVGNVTLESGTH